MSVLCLGEVLVDCFADGSSCPGGSPANVACHVAQAGVPAALVSRVGRDDAGDLLLGWIEHCRIGAGAVQRDDEHPTGTVQVRLTPHGPVYDLAAPAAWDFIGADEAALAAVATARMLVFGALAQRHPVSRCAIRRLVLAAREAGIPCLADLNLRPPCHDAEIILWTLRHCQVLKLNLSELRAVSDLLGARGETLDLFEGLVREFSVEKAVLTAGADGAWIREDGAIAFVPAHPAEEIDPVGAGDAFTAMLACGMTRGRSLVESAPAAARLSAWVVSSRGATPAWGREIRDALGG